MAAPDPPIDADEGFALLDAVLAPSAGRVVLAVSGGPDSLALLVLAAENRRRFAAAGRRFLVVTVDHGLRPEATGEARDVARIAARYSLDHRTLGWTPNRRGNLSAAAREARYRLLAEAAREFGASAILTAHHQDDQIETHLMAAERGEGPVRLAGMRARRAVAPGLELGRPFLDLPKARLVATLEARGPAWSDDPTNHDSRYRRAAWRQRLASISASERDGILVRIAAAAAARARIEAGIAALLPHVAVSPDGAISMHRSALRCDREAARGLLSRALSAVGGASIPASGREVERLAQRLMGEDGFAATLGGCRVAAEGPRVDILREFGRKGPPVLALAGEERVVFDERFDIELRYDAGEARLVPLGALGRGGVRERTLPILVDSGGTPIAAHPEALPRLSGAPDALICRERISWRLARDLPAARDVIQIAAKPPRPVGKEMAADYLAI